MNARRYDRLAGAIVATLIAVMIACPAMAGTQVTNLTIAPQGDFTEVAVVGAGHALCDHFAEEATNGRPFRIVLDFCDATHALGQMNFTGLPASIVKRVRTSQFATDPQRIVRVVLDMRDEATYTVTPSGTAMMIRIVDPTHGSFAKWQANPQASAPVMAQKAPEAKPATQATKTSMDVSRSPMVAERKAVSNPVAVVTPVQKSTPAPVSRKPVTAKPTSTPTPLVSQPTVIARTDTPKLAVIPSPSPAPDVNPAATKPTVMSQTEMVSPVTVATTPQAKPLPLPPIPLVFAPGYSGESLSKPVFAQTPAAKPADQIKIAKVSMTPIGPPQPDSPAGQEMASAEQSKSAMWASTTPAPMNAVGTDENSEQQTSSSAANPTSPAEPVALIDRLKSKFFGAQSRPRPYTTVTPDMINGGADGLQGPPSPNASLSREDLLERIKQAQASMRAQGTTPTGVGGVPSREFLFYGDMGRRDPFEPLVTGQRSGFVTDELPNVETLRLVGVLRDDAESIALLENLEGYGYILRTGDKVQNGSLIAVQNNRALFQIDEYGWSHVIALQLTSRGTDPSKSLGAVQQNYPDYEDYEKPGASSKSATGNQGSDN